MHASSETLGVTETVRAISPSDLLSAVVDCLDSHKAEDLVSLDLGGKSSFADHMVIASGRSQRQVSALADYLAKAIKGLGHKDISVQGLEQADWVLIDAGDVVVHIFRPEVRAFYNLDKMWGAELEDAETLN